jgi:hypothetical protein
MIVTSMLHKTYYLPTLTYGTETLVLIKRYVSRLQAAERFLESIKKCTRDKIQNHYTEKSLEAGTL